MIRIALCVLCMCTHFNEFTHCTMGADKLSEYRIIVAIWRVLPFGIAVQHLGNNNLLPIETLVKNCGDDWVAGVLWVGMLLSSTCYKQGTPIVTSSLIEYKQLYYTITSTIRLSHIPIYVYHNALQQNYTLQCCMNFQCHPKVYTKSTWQRAYEFLSITEHVSLFNINKDFSA